MSEDKPGTILDTWSARVTVMRGHGWQQWLGIVCIGRQERLKMGELTGKEALCPTHPEKGATG